MVFAPWLLPQYQIESLGVALSRPQRRREQAAPAGARVLPGLMRRIRTQGGKTMKRAALLLFALAGLAACDTLSKPSEPTVASPLFEAAQQGPLCLATGELATS